MVSTRFENIRHKMSKYIIDIFIKLAYESTTVLPVQSQKNINTQYNPTVSHYMYDFKIDMIIP